MKLHHFDSTVYRKRGKSIYIPHLFCFVVSATASAESAVLLRDTCWVFDSSVVTDLLRFLHPWCCCSVGEGGFIRKRAAWLNSGDFWFADLLHGGPKCHTTPRSYFHTIRDLHIGNLWVIYTHLQSLFHFHATNKNQRFQDSSDAGILMFVFSIFHAFRQKFQSFASSCQRWRRFLARGRRVSVCLRFLPP